MLLFLCVRYDLSNFWKITKKQWFSLKTLFLANFDKLYRRQIKSENAVHSAFVTPCWEELNALIAAWKLSVYRRYVLSKIAWRTVKIVWSKMPSSMHIWKFLLSQRVCVINGPLGFFDSLLWKLVATTPESCNVKKGLQKYFAPKSDRYFFWEISRFFRNFFLVEIVSQNPKFQSAHFCSTSSPECLITCLNQ